MNKHEKTHQIKFSSNLGVSQTQVTVQQIARWT